MTDFNDGKIHGWDGGECPVHPETVVRVWLYDGTPTKKRAKFLGWSWSHPDRFPESNIIAFQVVKEHREPKTIWVNEYAGGFSAIYLSEDDATRFAGSSATRIAVKYVEVIE